MKKTILMVAVMLGTTMTSYAEKEFVGTVETTETYDMTVNMRKLAVTLDMTFSQMEAVQDIHYTFCTEMQQAAQAGKTERKALVDAAVAKNMRYMRFVLNEKQYSKYQLLLDTTLQNRGLK